MLANQIEQTTEEKKSTQRTCEYQGVEYFVLTDMKGKCFIGFFCHNWDDFIRQFFR